MFVPLHHLIEMFRYYTVAERLGDEGILNKVFTIRLLKHCNALVIYIHSTVIIL